MQGRVGVQAYRLREVLEIYSDLWVKHGVIVETVASNGGLPLNIQR